MLRPRFSVRGVLHRMVATALLACGAYFGGPSIQSVEAQTVINVGTASDLVNALTTVDNNPGTSYQINLTQYSSDFSRYGHGN